MLILCPHWIFYTFMNTLMYVMYINPMKFNVSMFQWLFVWNKAFPFDRKLTTAHACASDGPIIAPMTAQRIDEGQTLRVRCDVQSNPPAKISWYTPDKNMYMTGPDLVLQAVTQSDAGIYVCQAKTTFYNQNQVTDTREVQVFVKCKSQQTL